MDLETTILLRTVLESYKEIQTLHRNRIEQINMEFNKLEIAFDKNQTIIAAIEQRFNSLTSRNEFDSFVPGSNRRRSKKINWGEKSINVLRSQNKLMTGNEILTCIFPDLTLEEKPKYSSKLSSSLYKLSKKKKIIKYDKGIKGHYFGLPIWFEKIDLPFEQKSVPKKEYLI